MTVNQALVYLAHAQDFSREVEVAVRESADKEEVFAKVRQMRDALEQARHTLSLIPKAGEPDTAPA